MECKLSKIALIAMLPALTCPCFAQFNTIRKKDTIGYEILPKSFREYDVKEIQQDTILYSEIIAKDTIPENVVQVPSETSKKQRVRKKHLEDNRPPICGMDRQTGISDESLPELNIVNLLAEIRKNGIRHEKVVLAQAILETGWFTSPVCRYKNNLFGLTNPRTKEYYEFSHWTESVKAYYTKVQYRYHGGNYLLWLDRIGYAEDPRYVSSLIKILRQYMM